MKNEKIGMTPTVGNDLNDLMNIWKIIVAASWSDIASEQSNAVSQKSHRSWLDVGRCSGIEIGCKLKLCIMRIDKINPLASCVIAGSFASMSKSVAGCVSNAIASRRANKNFLRK